MGENGFGVDKGRFYCGDVFDPSLVVVTCTDEESKGREMLDIHPLTAVGKQGGVLFNVFRLGG